MDRPPPTPSDPGATLVLFGGTGDLAKRKLVPALWELHRDGLLAAETAILGLARKTWDDEAYRRLVAEHLPPEATGEPRRAFLDRLAYVAGNLKEGGSFQRLRSRLEEIEKRRGLAGNRLLYLAIPPGAVGPTVGHLDAAGLARPSDPAGPWTRLVVEKPFGKDLHEARELSRQLAGVFHERQIFRIDHYLGKETTQNILVFRLGNGLFEPLWNQRYVDHVQITVAETIGVENRGETYEQMGALRDIIENHVLQLLCLVAMEPPVAFDADAVRDEKVKVLRSIRRQTPEEILRHTVRGQYGAGRVGGEEAQGYREEAGVLPNSLRDTYAAWRLEIENWRWAGVPFYLRAGKRLRKRVTEIAIVFKTAPIAFFANAGVPTPMANQLVLRIQPDEGIELHFGAKEFGPTMRIQPRRMDFRYQEQPPDAYERLLLDALLGDPTLFARRDEVEAAWELVTPVLDTWRANPPPDMPNYRAGSWGPEAAKDLIRNDGRSWRRP